VCFGLYCIARGNGVVALGGHCGRVTGTIGGFASMGSLVGLGFCGTRGQFGHHLELHPTTSTTVDCLGGISGIAGRIGQQWWCGFYFGNHHGQCSDQW